MFIVKVTGTRCYQICVLFGQATKGEDGYGMGHHYTVVLRSGLGTLAIRGI